MSVKSFNIRVYGLCVNGDGKLLIAHEQRKSLHMTKFPGGGLEWGEGLADALKREFWEELGWEIEVVKQLYITDFFQVSAFNAQDQVISVYFVVRTQSPMEFPEFPNPDEFIQFEWRNLFELEEEDFTFPIDRYLVRQLKTGKLVV